MKTNSSTFEPKQSDMTYWYNTTTGYTIVAEKDIDTSTLQSLLPTEVTYGNISPASITEWIDLSSNVSIPRVAIYKIHQHERIQNEQTDRICFHFDIEQTGVETYVLWQISETKFEEFPHLTYENAPKRHMMMLTTQQPCQEAEMTLMLYGIEAHQLDDYYYFRLCHKYVEDGVERFAYSPMFEICYNELPR